MTPYLSVVVPLYNEDKRLLNGFQAIYSYLAAKSYTWEIVLVDDGSTDNTPHILSEITSKHPNTRMIRNERNLGKGGALKSGMPAAQGDIIVFTDIDLSVPLSSIDVLAAKISDGYDIALGSRKTPGAIVEVHQPLMREFMGKGYTMLSNILLGTHFNDHTCGLKAFTRTAAHDLFNRMRIERWAFDSEILYLSTKLGYTAVEVPVQWRDMPGTRVRIFKDAVRSFAELVKIRFYHMRDKS